MASRRLLVSFSAHAVLVLGQGVALGEEAGDGASAPAGEAAAHTSEVAVSDAARQHFRTGVAYMQDPDGARYEEAYAEFKAAYADSPSWKILGNLGITAMKLERDGEAVWAFQTYLEEGGDRIDPSERHQFERDLNTVSAGLAWVTVDTEPPGAIIVDERLPPSGQPVVNRYDGGEGPQRIGVRRGRHRFTARLPGRENATWEVDLEPGQDYSHKFELPETAAAPGTVQIAPSGPVVTERPIPIPVYITAGATGLLLVGAGVTGFMAIAKASDYDDVNDGFEPAYAESLRSQGQRLNLMTDLMLGGAVLAGAATAILYVTRPEVPVRDTASLRVTPQVGPQGGAVALTGRF
jgi:hypothetical protein